MSDVFEKIDKDIKTNKILIYIKGTREAPQCGFSASVMDIFQVLGYPFETRNVLEDNEVKQEIKKHSNWPTFPQVFINGKFIGGCDITKELYERGELQKLVEESLKN